MARARTTLIALGAAAAAAGIGGGIGQAQADGGSSGSGDGATPATIVVNGTATQVVAGNADGATQKSAYMTALSGAVSDAGLKANAIAGQVGVTLGAVENVTEESDSSGDLCQGEVWPVEAQRSSGASGGGGAVANGASSGVAAPAAGAATGTGTLDSASGSAKASGGPAVMDVPPNDGTGTQSCSIEADVTVTYLVG